MGASARVNGLGQTPGKFMTFKWPHDDDSFEVGVRFTQNSLVHEFGHYGFGLYEMTTDRESGLKLPGHWQFLPAITNKNGDLMLRGGDWWISTVQEEENRESCWGTIARKLGIPNLTSAPSTNMPAGFADIKWVVMTNELRTTEVLDRSASMAGYDMEQARDCLLYTSDAADE